MSRVITAYLSIFNLFKLNELWPYYQKHVNQIILLESNSPDILAMCDTNLDDSINSGNFSVRGNLPLIWKDSSTHVHGLTVFCVKEGISFAWNLSLENSSDSCLCFRLALLHAVPYFFFINQSPSTLSTVFYSILSNIDEFLSINPSANFFCLRRL